MTTDALPLSPDTLAAAAPDRFDDFRLSSPPEVHALLKRLLDANVALHLNTPQGAVYTTMLWAIDPERGMLAFSADSTNPHLQRVLEAEEITVVGYLESIKVQFELSGMVLLHGTTSSALNAHLPREVFRFQRRSGFRVRPLGRSALTAYLSHPMIPDMRLALRVLDMSIGGCALFLPDDVPTVTPGVRVNAVQIELDASTRIRSAIVIHHVTGINPESHGVRLGCELVGMTGEATRALQLFIDLTEKRRRMLSRG
jgi:c-di-GMP-binding flagellar brake protein YcgR